MEIKVVKLAFPEGCNLILGQTHFIKSVEDLYEIMVSSTPAAKFGVAFCEASGPCLVRKAGTDDEMVETAIENALMVGAGHTFVIVMKDMYPINVLNAIKDCPEVCRVFCATANPIEVVVGETGQGRGVLGVVDGSSPQGVESATDRKDRQGLLRRFGYKLG